MKTHKSHISSSEAKSRGWSRVPSPAIQQETRNQEVGTDYMSGNYVSISANDCSGSDFALTSSGTVDMDNTTATITWGDATTYYPYQTWGSEWDDTTYPQPQVCSDTITFNKIIKEGVTIDMRTLFKVYVVDPRKNGRVLLDGFLVIAVNENQAMLKAGVADIACKAGLDLEQVDVYVQTIGTFIRPRKETQRVKITKEEDE